MEFDISMKTMLALFLTILMVTSDVDAGQISELRYKNWVGGAFDTDDTELFSHCVVYTDFKHGGWLYLGVLLNGQTGIGFSNDKWLLPTQEALNGMIQVDDRYLKPFTSNPYSSSLFYVYFSPSDPIFEAVRRGRALTIEFNGQSISYDLSGTAIALDLVKSCVEEHKNTPASSARNTAADLWVSENTWFMEPEKNKLRHTKALEINADLLSEGWDDTKLVFYGELDRRLESAMRDEQDKNKKHLSEFFNNS